MSRNDEVAALLEEFADLLEATGVEYKPTAYRRAAENVREHTAPIENLAGGGEDAVAGSTAWATPSRRRSSSTFETGSIEELEALRSGAPRRHQGADRGRGRRSEDGRQPLRGAQDHDARRTRGGSRGRTDPRGLRLRREDRGEHPRQHPVRARGPEAHPPRRRAPGRRRRPVVPRRRPRRGRVGRGVRLDPALERHHRRHRSARRQRRARAHRRRRSPRPPRPTRRSRPAPGRRAFARAATRTSESSTARSSAPRSSTSPARAPTTSRCATARSTAA